jgi:hypothetical protein
MVHLSVADQGEGIAPEHVARVTERFYRVDTSRSRSLGGTGLGLSIVKHIVERHRGRLSIDSELGRARPCTCSCRSRRAAGFIKVSCAPLKQVPVTKPRLLLVEDDRALADLLMWHFDREGYDVVRTADGEEALLLAEERTPDLVILDWMIEGRHRHRGLPPAAAQARRPRGCRSSC